MVIHSKRYREAIKELDLDKLYSVEQAVGILKEFPNVSFDETVDFAANLKIDIKKTDQLVRGTVVLPHGTGKEMRVIAFCKGKHVEEAKEAGAIMAGSDELIEKVEKGWVDFDAAVATHDMMREIGKLGRVLGPRGLMPNPKAGTLCKDVGETINQLRKGKIEFKAESGGNIHVPVGKISFEKEKIKQNVVAVIEALKRAKPVSVKSGYIRKAVLTTTMGPGIKLSI